MTRRLSKELGLADEPQDWGIVNADAARLDEFVEVYSRGETFPRQNDSTSSS